MPCGRGNQDRFKRFWKEKKEHPRMTDKQIWQIVKDHERKEGKKR